MLPEACGPVFVDPVLLPRGMSSLLTSVVVDYRTTAAIVSSAHGLTVGCQGGVRVGFGDDLFLVRKDEGSPPSSIGRRTCRVATCKGWISVSIV